MLGSKLVKAGWDNADYIAGRRGPDLPSTGMLKVQLFDGSLCTNHLSQRLTNIWCRDERSVSADRRCLCVSQSIEHCVNEGGNTRAESCPRAHHHCREMSQNHILQTPGPCCPCTVFVCLCLSTSPCVSCVSGLNTPRSGLRILLTWNAPSFQD